MLKLILTKLINIVTNEIFTKQELIQRHGGKIGKGVFFGADVLIDLDFAFLLEIGNGAVIAARTIIELHDSCIPNVLGCGKAKIGKIKIGNKAYIGVNSVILPGVQIGDGAIVGACSLVNCNIPAGQVWAGVPADYICTVDELEKKRNCTFNTLIGYFDWMGELEKEKVNYAVLKAQLLNQVRGHFNV